MQRVSWRNPPSTGHVRPERRKFFVWQDRHITFSDEFAASHGWEVHPWRWLCTMCEPPSAGYRVKEGAFQAIMSVSMPRHMLVRRQHHEWVAGHAES